MPRRWRVLLTDRPWPDASLERRMLAEVDAELVEPATDDPAELARLAESADAIGVCWAPLAADLIERCVKCRIIARFGTGLDNVPLPTATRSGIPVTFVPDYCITEVADHTFALILSLLRSTVAYDRALKAGEYAPGRYAARRLSSLTLGIVGFGRIGRAVAARAEVFGMRVLATSRRDQPPPLEHVGLSELLSRADVVSLHLPLSPETWHCFDSVQIARMNQGAFLVNTARGALVDPQALLAALESGHLAGAALDVFDPEPPAMDDRLIRHPRLIATPHVAFRSIEAVEELRVRATRQIIDALQGSRPEHVVNPEVYGVS